MKLNGNKIEHEIVRRAMSYKDVANAAGITERTLKQARAGAEIQPATAGRIAAALGVDVDEIIK